MNNERQLSRATEFKEFVTASPMSGGAASTSSSTTAGQGRLSSSRAPQLNTGGPRQSRKARPFQRALIVGTDETGLRLANELRTHFPDDFVIVGFVAAEDEAEHEHNSDIPLLGNRKQLSNLVRHHHINRVMYSNCVDWQLEGTGLRVRSSQDRRAQGDRQDQSAPQGKVVRERRREVGDLYQWATSHSFLWPKGRRAKLYKGAKRAFDIAFSLVALTLSLPLALIVFPTIKLTSPGPIFYEQERVGRGGKSFIIYKLRTMSVNAEKETGPTLSPQGDKRSTWFGRMLRVLKLDEFPQFWNVLKGDMSIVGPRPERPHFVQPFEGHIYSYSLRHQVQPGLTGLAQVKGDHLTHVYVKLHYDLIYVCKRNLLLDLTILARTPLFIVQNMMRRG